MSGPRERTCRPYPTRIVPCVVVVACCATAVAAAGGCGRRGTADSATDPKFATPAQRVAWMKGRMQATPPSAIRDAHFSEREMKVRGGHMGPGYSMFWLCAKIEINPQDAPKWAAATKPATRRWAGGATKTR